MLKKYLDECNYFSIESGGKENKQVAMNSARSTSSLSKDLDLNNPFSASKDSEFGGRSDHFKSQGTSKQYQAVSSHQHKGSYGGQNSENKRPPRP